MGTSAETLNPVLEEGPQRSFQKATQFVTRMIVTGGIFASGALSYAYRTEITDKNTSLYSKKILKTFEDGYVPAKFSIADEDAHIERKDVYKELYSIVRAQENDLPSRIVQYLSYDHRREWNGTTA